MHVASYPLPSMSTAQCRSSLELLPRTSTSMAQIWRSWRLMKTNETTEERNSRMQTSLILNLMHVVWQLELAIR